MRYYETKEAAKFSNLLYRSMEEFQDKFPQTA